MSSSFRRTLTLSHPPRAARRQALFPHHIIPPRPCITPCRWLYAHAAACIHLPPAPLRHSAHSPHTRLNHRSTRSLTPTTHTRVRTRALRKTPNRHFRPATSFVTTLATPHRHPATWVHTSRALQVTCEAASCVYGVACINARFFLPGTNTLGITNGPRTRKPSASGGVSQGRRRRGGYSKICRGAPDSLSGRGFWLHATASRACLLKSMLKLLSSSSSRDDRCRSGGRGGGISNAPETVRNFTRNPLQDFVCTGARR